MLQISRETQLRLEQIFVFFFNHRNIVYFFFFNRELTDVHRLRDAKHDVKAPLRLDETWNIYIGSFPCTVNAVSAGAGADGGAVVYHVMGGW